VNPKGEGSRLGSSSGPVGDSEEDPPPFTANGVFSVADVLRKTIFPSRPATGLKWLQ
jgi:hypothetical protein